jgi:hypothetical protein
MLQVCLYGCCICFTHMLQLFYLDVAYMLQWFSSVLLFLSGLDTCFKCFICLQTYVASVVYGCFKSRSSVASPSSPCVSSSPSVALHPSQTRRERARGWWRGRERMLSPSVMRGCFDGMLPLVGLGLEARLRFGWLGLGAASGRTDGAGRLGASASCLF